MHTCSQLLQFPDPQASLVPASVYWREAIIQRQFGLECKVHKGRPFQAALRSWALGSVKVAKMSLEGHSVLAERKIAPQFPHEYVFLKLVVSGEVMFDEFGDRLSVRSGGMVLVDPDRRFNESFVAPTELVLVMLPKRELRERGLLAEVDRPLVQDASSPENTLLWHLLLAIVQHGEQCNAKFRERLGAQIMDLTDHLVCTENQHNGSRTAAATCARIKCYLKQHLGDVTLDTAAVAAAMRLSPRSIGRLFAAEGTSLMRYLWTRRLERAHAILHGAGAPGIEEVAWRCGFSDATHFSRSFKARYGCSPREFRRMSTTANYSVATSHVLKPAPV